MMPQLSSGAVETIMNGGEVIQPIVQVLGNKVIPGQGAPDRYRLLISDGVHLCSFAMLATQLTPILKSGSLEDNSVIRIKNHVVSVVKNPSGKGDKRIMVILDMDILKKGSEIGHRIGNPMPLNEPSLNSTSTSSSNSSSAPSATSNNNVPITQPKSTPMTKGRKSVNETVFNSPSNYMQGSHPICSLSPYHNSWTIKARVTSKSAIRTWSNARSEGRLFSIDLVDSSGEIRATAFKEQADKFYDMIQENKVYYISKGRLKIANKQFTTISHDYEMTFTNETKVIECDEPDESIPHLQFNFASISSIQDTSANSLLDFIGICKATGDIVTLTSRTNNRELKKRELTIVDSSLASVTVTLWGQQAEDFNGDGCPVVAVKGARVSEYGGGKSLSLVASSVLQINPDISDAHRLRGWYDCLTPDAKFNTVSGRAGDTGGSGVWMMLGEATRQNVGCGDKADYFNCYATVMHIRTDRCIYKACPSPDCNKKVIDQNNGMYRCEKCNKEFDSFKYRLMLSVNIGDFSGNQWITAFQESAEEIIGHSAEDIGRWQEEDSNKFSRVFRDITLRPYQFRLRAKMENFNDESRVKMSVTNVKKPDYKERCRRLLAEIKEMTGISTGH